MSDSSSTSILVNNKMLTRELTIVFSSDSGPADKVEQLKSMTSYFMVGNVRVTLFKHDNPAEGEELMTEELLSELFTQRDYLPAYTQACEFTKSVLKLDRGDKVAAIKLSNETV